MHFNICNSYFYIALNYFLINNTTRYDVFDAYLFIVKSQKKTNFFFLESYEYTMLLTAIDVFSE